MVYPDETGWREGGYSVWLWVFTNRSETVYSIQPGRGYAEASEVLGEGFVGVLVADGWAPYQKFEEATHQTCLAHLLRRCEELLEKATGGAVRFPRAVKEILQAALEARDQRDAGKLSGEALEKVKQDLELPDGKASVGAVHEPRQPASGSAFDTSPGAAVCLPGTHGCGGDQLAGRTRDSPGGHQPQDIWGKSDGRGVPGASGLDECPAHISATPSRDTRDLAPASAQPPATEA